MNTIYLVLIEALFFSGALFLTYRLTSSRNKQKLKKLQDEHDDLHHLLQTEKETKDQLISHACSKEMLIRLVDQSPNAIMLMDADGNILYVNQGFENMYEYSFDEFTRALGKNYRQTSFSPNVEQRLRTIRETKQPIRYEAPNITRTGRSLWTQTALMPILDEKNEITHLVTIDTDIHQRVVKSDNLVRETERLNQQLDQLVEQFSLMGTDFKNLFVSIGDLYLLIDKTDSILKFIKEISDKTRILGFNASIEANRAGSHGLGFRVITNEIVEISAKTIDSINQINHILSEINTKQQELMGRKESSEFMLKEHQNIFSELKKEVIEIETSIEEFKSLA